LITKLVYSELPTAMQIAANRRSRTFQQKYAPVTGVA